jgi:ATP-dependent RNA helicase RhlE
MGPQEHAFRSGVDVIVATPGRLLDHFQHAYARLTGLEILVLDEADRMLDMGFLPDIRRVLKHLPTRRQTLFFSATLPPAIVQLSREMLKNPAMISIERKAAPAAGITQSVFPVPQELKMPLLETLLDRGEIQNAIVFTRTKHRANRLADLLVRSGIHADRIHGNRTQGQRTKALDGFRSGRVPVLVATDIAARGIDVEALGHVVNFDVPLVPEDYIHRIGRTGRAEATGAALTFAAPDERGELAAIERTLGRPLPRVTVPDFDYHQRASGPLEIPIAQRIAEHRSRKAHARSRQHARPHQHRPPHASGSGSGSGGEHPSKGPRRRWSFRPRRRR